MTHQQKLNCPETTQLLDYLGGRVQEDVLLKLESHLKECDSCGETIRGLSDNDTISRLVGEIVQGGEPSLDEELEQTFVKNLVERIQASSTPHAVELRNRAQEVTRRLNPDAGSLGRVGQYEVQHVLGVGSTSVVYQARDTQLDRLVALKVLRPSVGPAAQTRFMSEARSAASIDHPNVVTIYQVGEADGLAFIAMKWVPGETLESRLQTVTFLSQEKLFPIMQQICAGLSVAHERNLIHRDLKPANIWLTDGEDAPIILDFGLARIADDDPHLTATGMIAGTPNFMSPEQAKGLELDARSDLFSLGCVMYRAMTGKLPFGGTGILSTLQAIQSEQPNPPNSVNSHISSDTSDLIMCLLEKQPGNRPDNSAQLKSALEAPRAEWPFSAAPASTENTRPNHVSRQAKSAKSGLVKWMLLALTVGMLMAGLFYQEKLVQIVTNHGVLEIDAQDENVKVEVLQNGDLVRIIDTETNQKLDVKAGTYQLKIQNPKNGFELTADSVVMTRGSKAIVSVKKRENAIEPNMESNRNRFGDLNEPVYNARTYSEWIRQLKFEKSEAAIGEAVTAVGTLIAEQPQLQAEAIEAVRPVARLYGSIRIEKDDDLPTRLLVFMSRLTPERAFEFVEEEIRTGTLASRNLCRLRLLVSTNAFFGVPIASPELEELFFRNRIQLIQKALLWLKNGTKADRQWAVDFTGDLLCRFYRRHDHSYQPKDQVFKELASDHAAKADLAKLYYKYIRAEESLKLAELMIDLGVSSNAYVERIVSVLKDESISIDIRQRAFNTSGNIKGYTGKPLVEYYLELLESAEMRKALWEGYTYTSDTPEYLVFSKMQIIRQTQTDPNFGPSKMPVMEGIIIERLGRLGEWAKPARKKLMSYKNDAFLADFAIEALSKIDAELEKWNTIGRAGNDMSGDFGGESNNKASAPGGGNMDSGGALGMEGDGFDNAADHKLPVYDGRTFDQWLSTLEVERNTATVAQGLVALSHLMGEDRKQQERAIPAVRTITRRLGSQVIEGRDTVPSCLITFFSKLDADLFFRFIKTEVREGNKNSKMQNLLLLFLSSDSGIDGHRHIDPKSLRKQFAKHQMTLLQDCISADQLNSWDETQTAVLLFQSFANIPQLHSTEKPENHKSRKREQIGYALKALDDAKEFGPKVLLVGLLVSLDYESESMAKMIFRGLTLDSVDGEVLKAAYDISTVWKTESAKHFVPGLTALFENETKLSQIAKIQDRNNVQPFVEPNSALLIQIKIIQNLERLASASQSAIPFLKKYQTHNSFGQFAKSALKKIERTGAGNPKILSGEKLKN